MMSCQKIVTSLLFFKFTANLEQSGYWIPDAQSVKPDISLIVTFYLTKTENRTKKSLKQLSHYCLEYYFEVAGIIKVLFWPKNTDFQPQKMLTSAKLRVPWY